MNKVLYIVVLILIAIITFLWYRPQPVQDNRLQQAMDSLIAHDRIREEFDRQSAIRDSLWVSQIRGINRKIDNIPYTIEVINKKYNDKRSYISTLPDDEQLRILSEFLSSADSL